MTNQKHDRKDRVLIHIDLVGDRRTNKDLINFRFWKRPTYFVRMAYP